MRRFALVAAGSAILLTLCDQLFHVRTETLIYHWDPQVAGQTIIVPLMFLLATVSMLDTSVRVNAVQPCSTSIRGVVASLAIVIAVYLTSGFVDQRYAFAYAVLLLVAFGARFVLRREGVAVLVSSVMIATGGVLGEAALSAIGEFSYLHPDLLGVPWWLFPLYLHGAFAARDIASVLSVRDASDENLERVAKV